MINKFHGMKDWLMCIIFNVINILNSMIVLLTLGFIEPGITEWMLYMIAPYLHQILNEKEQS